jgi:capsular polysaccharide biosynthesis protein
MSSRNQLAFRRRWWILPIAIAVGLFGAVLATQATEPTYKATCRLFVAVNSQTSPAETNQAGQFAEDRVITYLPLIKGDWVAWDVIHRLGLNMSVAEFEKRIEATAELKSVLMNVSFSDSNSQRSADLANAVCTEFQAVAADIERPNSQITVKLVEKADSPRYPVSPSGKRNLAAGALVGLLVGWGLVLLVGRISPEGGPDLKTVKPDHDSRERRDTVRLRIGPSVGRVD